MEVLLSSTEYGCYKNPPEEARFIKVYETKEARYIGVDADILVEIAIGCWPVSEIERLHDVIYIMNTNKPRSRFRYEFLT